MLIRQVVTAPNFEGRVTLIPENKEKYISFTKYVKNTKSNVSFRFLDSFRFMASSLEKLSSYLEECSIVNNEFTRDGCSPEQIQLLTRKGVYPYDFTSSFDALRATELPSMADFHSCLYEQDIEAEDYEHAQNVWETFQIKDLGEYSDLYLKTDVLLLADVFESFRNNCMSSYGLDPAHYYTTPGFAWDAMLKFTNVKLELLTDIDMFLFVERGIRGGVSQCSNRFAESNNKYLPDYKEDEQEKFITYFDVNNLYGYGMTMPLPYGAFEWVEDVEQKDPNFWKLPDDSEIGYYLDVELEYPKEIHDEHSDLPFCPEHRAAPGSKQKKLMTTLYDKERYVIHHKALEQATNHGVILKKINKVLKFKQTPWLKNYIEFNNRKRQNAQNEFEKMLFKLMNNAVYGKTMENERKRKDVKVVGKWNGRYGAEALIAKPNFHSCTIFNEDLVGIQLDRTEITIRKPIYVGLAVLDISKVRVYRFHYDYMKKTFNNNCKLLYTDTDSLIYEISQVDIYEKMRQNCLESIEKQEFDTSDYKVDNVFKIPLVNKKVLGLMKDECNGRLITRFIGLRSKMYCVEIEQNSLMKKAKGVKSIVVKNKISFEDYYNCLFDGDIAIRNQRVIRSRKHKLFTEEDRKIALSPHDDKRYLIPESTDTLAWGHYLIPINEPMEVEQIETNDDDDNEPANKRARLE